MRTAYIIDTLTGLDIKEIVKTARKVIENYEGVIYRENIKLSPFKKVIDNLFDLRQKQKDENNDVMQLLVKLIMSSSYGEQICKDFEESFGCNSEAWMLTEYDERVLDCQNINYSNYIVKLKDDAGIKDDV